ncbi:MAG: hypothetical protein IJ748_02800 [Bacteroidales bacterium]|nr:hypothetical protein [Bacteroidales bacterium]
MTALLILLIIVCFIIYRKRKKEKIKPIITIETDNPVVNFVDKTTARASKIIRKSNNGWVINPGMPFELTVSGVDYDKAFRVHQLCEQNDWKANQELLGLFATFNIKVAEIEAYKNKYAPVLYNRIEELKRESIEYQNADEQDREDMDEEFLIDAQETIYELPDFDVYKLFHSYDITIDDELLNEFGFECIRAYFTYAKKVGKVITIQKESSFRTAFEKMTQVGLAMRGKDIPIEEVLYSQTLKTLNEIAQCTDKEFKRKNAAIEYIVKDSDSLNRIGKYIAYRELFKLLPLPDKYSSIDIDIIRKVWDCHEEEVRLLMHTYQSAKYIYRQSKDEYTDDKSYQYKVQSVSSRCQRAKDMMKKTYPHNEPPHIPCHIGCSCWLTLTQH